MKPPGNNINAAKNHPNWNIYRNAILEDIQKRKPKVILALGAEALKLLAGDVSIKSLSGYLMPFKDTVVVPTWHPAKVLRQDSMMFAFRMDIAKAKQVYVYGVDKDFYKLPIPTYPYSKSNLIELLDTVAEKDILWSLDIETAQSPWKCNCIGIACEEGSANAYPDMEVIEALKRAIKKNGRNTIFHNGSFDMTWLYGEYGLEWEEDPHDTMLMMHILFCDQPKSLEFCSSIFLNVPSWKHMRLEYGSKGMYNIIDCVNTLLLYYKLKEGLEQLDAWEVYNKQKRRELLPAIFMGYLGMDMRDEKIQEHLLNVETKMEQLEEKLSLIVGEEINYNSHTQMTHLLYSRWKLPVQKKKGKITSSEEAIKALIKKTKNETIIDWLKTYHEWKKLSSIKSKELQIERCVFTNLVHTSYNVAGTEGARWSSSTPLWGGGTNFQNRMKKYTDIYVPRFKDWIFVSRDYSGAEAWITAWRCGDDLVKEVFYQNGDLHKITAAMMFGISIDEVTPELRQIGKKIRHASNYDMTWRTLMKQMEITAAEAKELMHRFHSVNPRIHEVFQAKTKEIITRERVLRDAFGYPRVFTGRLDDGALREAYAFYPQSTCGHTINRAVVTAWDYYKFDKEVALNLQIHDELVFICTPERLIEVAQKSEEFMKIPIPIVDLETGQVNELTLKTSLAVGRTWGEMIEYKDNDYSKVEKDFL